MNEESARKVLFTMDEKFKFSCDKGLACFNRCCRDITIFLTPYDVLRMRKAAGLSSHEFLEKYTTSFLGDDGIPLVMLKMTEGDKGACPFVGDEGCSIYEDRPWSCRMYPVFPMSAEEHEFLIEEIATCLGFQENRELSVREWKAEQKIDVYDTMNKSYKEITHHQFFQMGNKLDPGRAKLLYTACYDLDWFKRFVFESKFFDKYDVDEELIEKMRNDDEALLNFSYRWIRSNLFSEDTLRLRDRKMDELLHSKSKASL